MLCVPTSYFAINKCSGRQDCRKDVCVFSYKVHVVYQSHLALMRNLFWLPVLASSYSGCKNASRGKAHRHIISLFTRESRSHISIKMFEFIGIGTFEVYVSRKTGVNTLKCVFVRKTSLPFTNSTIYGSQERRSLSQWPPLLFMTVLARPK